MLRSIQQRDLDRNRWIKISMGVILVLICVSMVVTLVPGLMSGPTGSESPDAVATIAGQSISINEFQQQFDQVTRNQSVPQMMRGIYANQLLNDMVFRDALDYEAGLLGIQVTAQQEAERIRELIPSAWSGNTWLKDRYAAEVQQQTNMTVDQFESALHDQMVMDQFREMVTAGVTVSPAEIEQEFRWRNEKVKIDYALIKPSDLAASIRPTDAELSAWFAKNLGKYQIPEKRSARYALLDLTKLRASTQISDDELKAYYNANIDQFKVENRVHVEDILFKTVGKTDAEIAEIRKQAEDVLKQAKKGGNFEDLAKKYSDDDASKVKGGDLGWIVEGQTVPEFEKVAFGTPKGQISDLVQTQYGFQIIKVLDHETAHTKTFDEVRASILQPVTDQKVTDEANNISDQMAAAVRQSDRQPLDDLAKKFHLDLGETQPVSVTDPVGQLGNTPDLHQVLFSLHPGELSQPLPIDNGYVILTVKDILPGHQGTLAEVHDQALADYQKEKSIDLARSRADQLSKLVQGGQSFDQAAKSLGLTLKTSDSFARNGSIPDVGTGRQVDAAFNMMVGQVGAPVQIDSNWLVYRVVSHDAANPDDLAKQRDAIEQQLLQTKQNAAFEAFHNALVDQLKSEGKLTINTDLMKRFNSPS
jgi:peptidyl-prolyl cis-trans isomerase D